MNDWLAGLRELGRRGETAALVTVIQTRGSAPREPGAKMTVGTDLIWDSIGGGQLEHAAIESARLLLAEPEGEYTNTVERFQLGPSLGQCCGGVTSFMIERVPPGREWVDALMAARQGGYTPIVATAVAGREKRIFTHDGDVPRGGLALLVKRVMETGEPVLERLSGGTRWFIDPLPRTDFDIVLFGAGHVGKAVASVLATLPCTLTWVDSREDQFPEKTPTNVDTRVVREPEALVEDCPAGTFYLVMTHSHPLDFTICERILKRGDFAYCGLIGSASKRQQAWKRLRLRGITDAVWNRLTCPIGIEGITGKRPAEIAVAVAAEILQVRGSMRAAGHELGASTPAGKGKAPAGVTE